MSELVVEILMRASGRDGMMKCVRARVYLCLWITNLFFCLVVVW